MADTIRLIFKTHAVSEVKDIFDDFEDTMKAFKVTCAIIEQDGKILAARRGERMRLPLKWEFPGGKLHEGESPRECLKREIQEEMGISIEILIKRVASFLGASHPMGMDSSQEYANMFDPHIRGLSEIKIFGNIPSTYYQLLQIAQTITETLSPVFGE